MAYRRCISVRAALFARRSSPSIGYFSRENDRDKQEEFRSSRSKIEEYITQRTSLGSNVKSSSCCGAFFREGSVLAGGGVCMNRYMSTAVKDVATVLTDAPMEAVASQVPAMSEVAIAAADSPFPVAALQYLIDGVHSVTGLNWWASIALTTVLVRGATIPFLIHESQTFVKFLLFIPRPQEVLKKLLSPDPSARSEMLSKLEADFDDIVHDLPSAFLSLAIHVGLRGFIFIGFYLAITNMAEKVPSFENGGAFWFTDLTTPDAMCILPFLAALTFWARREFFSATPFAGLVKEFPKEKGPVFNVAPALFCAVLSFMNFPQAMYCHWITSNVFWCCYVYCLRFPRVKKLLEFAEKPIPGQGRKP